MKRILIFSIILLSIIGCTKDNNDDFTLSQAFLTGKWKMISFQNKSTSSGALISDFDLSTFPDSYITFNDTGLAVFNAPNETIDEPQQNNETYTKNFKVIEGEFHVLVETIVSSGFIDPTTGEHEYISKYIYVKAENISVNDGLLYFRIYNPTDVNGNTHVNAVNIRVFKKTDF